RVELLQCHTAAAGDQRGEAQRCGSQALHVAPFVHCYLSGERIVLCAAGLRVAASMTMSGVLSAFWPGRTRVSPPKVPELHLEVSTQSASSWASSRTLPRRSSQAWLGAST